MKNDFVWTPECRQALKELKRYLPIPPLLSKPGECEHLLIYLAVSEVAVEEEVEVSEFHIEYKPGTVIKSQVWVDFCPGSMPLAAKDAVPVSGMTSGRNEFIEHLRHGKLIEGPKASRALRTKEARYCLLDGQLYRRSFQGPLARCLGASEADYVMREVHEEVCGNHPCADSLVLKLVRIGHYWPQMEQDVKAFIQRCDKCQYHEQLVHQPAEPLHSVVSPWSFMKWGMDIVGLLPSGPEKFLSQSDFSGKVFNEAAMKSTLQRKHTSAKERPLNIKALIFSH
nr:uncharacterized protein LOC104117548 [Nicotiana tomentosiformis]